MNQQKREYKEKEAFEELEGIVIELLPNTTFKVKLDNEILVIAYASGKIKKNRIKILVNDRVVVEMTHYDLSQGRIIKRIK